MQLLASRGLEHGETAGLGWIPGDVVRIDPRRPGYKVPHMGWNTLFAHRDHALTQGMKLGPEGLHSYFLHSYHLIPADMSDVVAEADYAGPITAIVTRGNVAGAQFHPEKSQTLGLTLLRNFLRWAP
jgi:imidazole glycerol-phosphate synthase subunit HisH